MHRRFREHDRRQVADLRGYWDFTFLGNVDPAGLDVAGIEYDDVMAMPGCFDATPAYAAKRGLAAYRTRVAVADATPHRLILDGVHHWARVIVDGKALRDHVGGFTRWSVDFQPAEAGEAEIVVLVDNRIDYGRCPLHLDYFDWYHYGGIARGAELHRLGDAWIDAARVDVTDLAARRVRVAVDCAAARPGQAELSVRCAGQSVSRTVDLSAAPVTVELGMELADAALWSPSSPALHELYVTLGGDDLRDRVGLRTVETRDGQVLINGEPSRLLGFCRHEAHPQFGHGLPDSLIAADVQQLRDMNCNFVRGSHYPQDVRFLDLCDEMGICVWNESIGWQHTAEHLNDPAFVDAQRLNIEEMIAAGYNRPSVIMWGILNESHSHDDACRAGYENLLGRLRELDPARPITYACNHPMDDKCMDLADIISINTYPGWYGSDIEAIPGQLDAIVAHFDGEMGMSDKPMILSEIGAGALYGWRDDHETRWSEQYQARLLETVIRHLFIDGDRWCGLSIWQYGDCRTSHEVRKAIGRPRAFNNKGVVDEYRRPKQAYGTVKRMFGDLR